MDAGLTLGETIEAGSGERSGQPLALDAADLTTHGVIVGMTGSGKTGIGVVLLEEALRAGIPVPTRRPRPTRSTGSSAGSCRRSASRPTHSRPGSTSCCPTSWRKAGRRVRRSTSDSSSTRCRTCPSASSASSTSSPSTRRPTGRSWHCSSTGCWRRRRSPPGARGCRSTSAPCCPPRGAGPRARWSTSPTCRKRSASSSSRSSCPSSSRGCGASGVEAALAAVEARTMELADLEAELLDELAEIQDRWADVAAEVEEVEVGLEKDDIDVRQLALIWVPA